MADATDFRRLLTATIAADGSFVVVGEAADVGAAVALATTAPVDVVVMDLRAGGLRGGDLADALGQLSPDVRTVAMAGHVSPALLARLRRAGVWGFLPKGAAAEEVLNLLHRVAAADAPLLGEGTDHREPRPAKPAEPAETPQPRDPSVRGPGRFAGWALAVVVALSGAATGWTLHSQAHDAGQAELDRVVSETAGHLSDLLVQRVELLQSPGTALGQVAVRDQFAGRLIQDTMDTHAAQFPGLHLEIVDEAGATLVEAGPDNGLDGHGISVASASVSGTSWELAAWGPLAAFGDDALGAGHGVPWAMSVAATVLALLIGLGWTRMGAVAQAEREARHAVHEASARQAQFTAIASHELRTPTTLLAGFSQTLEERWDEFDEETRHDLVVRMSASARRMAGLVEDLMTASLAGSGTLRLSPRSIPVTELVETAIEGSRLADRRDDVLMDVPSDLAVRVDTLHGSRLLANLCDNAVKYGAAPYRVSAARVAGAVEIVVRDHGQGVPDTYREQLFAAYTQAEDHHSRRQGGIGLGLHTAQAVARQSGGDLRYEHADPGARFVLRLPAAIERLT